MQEMQRQRRVLRTMGAQKRGDQRLPEREGQGTETCIGAEAPLPQKIGKDPISNSTKERQAIGYK